MRKDEKRKEGKFALSPFLFIGNKVICCFSIHIGGGISKEIEIRRK